jgi:hypothetical protein
VQVLLDVHVHVDGDQGVQIQVHFGASSRLRAHGPLGRGSTQVRLRRTRPTTTDHPDRWADQRSLGRSRLPGPVVAHCGGRSAGHPVSS